jgi:DNA-binding MarR family transcriptional regulator
MTLPQTAPSVAPIPELMRAARGSYKRSIDAELAARGLEEVPGAGGLVLAYLAAGRDSIEEMVRRLGVTRQSFSQLVDSLVTRGYVTRDPHPDDRRRMVLALTERGRVAADAVMAGARAVDEQLAARLTDAELDGLRKGLAVLGEVKAAIDVG